MESSETPAPASPSTGGRALIVAWLVGACLVAGVAAEWSGMPTTWGNAGPVFWDYAFPLWLSYGFMHVPGLVAGALLLAWLHGRGPGDVALGRRVLWGALAAALLAGWDPIRWELDEDPFVFFMLVDAGTLLTATGFLPRRPDAPVLALPPAARHGALVAPVALVLVFQGVLGLTQPRYDAIQTDWDPVAEETRIWAYLTASVPTVADPAEECTSLAQFAVYAMSNPRPWRTGDRGRTVYVFRSRDGAMLRNPDTAWVSYQLKSSGEGVCRGPGGSWIGNFGGQ